MREWIKTVSASICIMTILVHLIPDGRFAKYVRFYAGLLIFFMIILPVLELLGTEGELERYLQLEFLKEDYYDLETAAAGLADLKNDQILEAFQEELTRQISEVAEAYGLQVASTEIDFGEDGYSIDSIALKVEAADDKTEEEISEAAAGARSEIAGLYLIPALNIEIIY
ncbi:MAG: stage III sporulation protein AF [Lachnospiraceae bacterium]|nr:stage III sporulation protein AF [Lachnospiraceae bacterium]